MAKFKMGEKKNNWRVTKDELGLWVFYASPKGKENSTKINDFLLETVEKVSNIFKNFFIPTKITAHIEFDDGGGKAIDIQNSNGVTAFDIKQILTNEINRLTSTGKDACIVI